MIYVIATIDVEAGKREDFLNEFRKIVPLVLAEQGCLEYGPAVDVATNLVPPSAIREDTVTIMEQWESLEALERHLIASHMLAYRAAVKGFVKGTNLRILQPV